MRTIEFRKAIPVHHTSTVDAPWDASEQVARLRNDETASYYRKMFAWVDPDANPDTKSAYKFPHHMVSVNGEIGAANIRACIAGIAALNGARGGADIPDSDVPDVYAHLAAHLEDAGREPPELASYSDIERRAYQYRAEIQPVTDDTKPKIVGYAAVFNSMSEDLGYYYEMISPGAFTESIAKDDIRALYNHDPNYILGRTKNGTLTLREDSKGLYVEIIPPDTTWASDVLKAIARGDIDQMSFGFKVIEERWQPGDEKPLRIIQKAQLFDVSPVTFPAYPTTEVYVRSYLRGLKALGIQDKKPDVSLELLRLRLNLYKGGLIR